MMRKTEQRDRFFAFAVARSASAIFFAVVQKCFEIRAHRLSLARVQTEHSCRATAGLAPAASASWTLVHSSGGKWLASAARAKASSRCNVSVLIEGKLAITRSTCMTHQITERFSILNLTRMALS
jgi:hypothetical protein